MTQQQEDTTIRTVFEIINAGGMENIGEAILILINEAMKAERSAVLMRSPGNALTVELVMLMESRTRCPI